MQTGHPENGYESSADGANKNSKEHEDENYPAYWEEMDNNGDVSNCGPRSSSRSCCCAVVVVVVVVVVASVQV